MRIAGPRPPIGAAYSASRPLLRRRGWSLAGCTSTGLPSFGGACRAGSRAPTAPGTEARRRPQAGVDSRDCPAVDIRTGAGTLAVAAKSRPPTANDLRYQLSFIELARQCFVDGGTVRMRVGVQGRAVVGPAGAPPQVNVPIRYAVVREGVQPKTIVTKFRRVPVALPPARSTTFTDIEEDLSFPMPPPGDLEDTSSMSASTKPATGSSGAAAEEESAAARRIQPKPQHSTRERATTGIRILLKSRTVSSGVSSACL